MEGQLWLITKGLPLGQGRSRNSVLRERTDRITGLALVLPNLQ